MGRPRHSLGHWCLVFICCAPWGGRQARRWAWGLRWVPGYFEATPMSLRREEGAMGGGSIRERSLGGSEGEGSKAREGKGLSAREG